MILRPRLPVVRLLFTCLRVAGNVLLALRSRTRLVQLSSLRMRPWGGPDGARATTEGTLRLDSWGYWYDDMGMVASGSIDAGGYRFLPPFLLFLLSPSLRIIPSGSPSSFCELRFRLFYRWHALPFLWPCSRTQLSCVRLGTPLNTVRVFDRGVRCPS